VSLGSPFFGTLLGFFVGCFRRCVFVRVFLGFLRVLGLLVALFTLCNWLRPLLLGF
jgi:hypothetical protein